MSHEARDEISEIFFGDANFEGNVCYHESSHLFGICKGAGGDCWHEVHARNPGEGIPKLAVVIILITSVVVKRRLGTFSLSSLPGNRRHGNLGR